MLLEFLNNQLSKKYIYFSILLILAVIFLWKNPDVAMMLFAAIIFACALMPLVDKLSLRINRNLATTIVLTGLIIVTSICVLPILSTCIMQIADFAKAFPVYVDNINDAIASIPMLKNAGIVHIDMETISSSFANSSSDILDSILNFIKETSSAFLYIFTALMFLFFFLADNKLIKKNILNIFPSEIRKRTDEILTNIAKKLSGYVIAQVIVSGSVWITMTLGLLLCNIQYALVLGLIAGVLSIIPVVGSALSLLICLIACFGSGIKVLILITILFTLSHFIENQVVRPYVYSKFLSLHPIIVFLALFIGAKYAGVVGVIFAPPFAMALCILLDELYVKKMN